MSTSFDTEQVYRTKVQQSGTSHDNSCTLLRSEPSFSIYSNTQNPDNEDGNELAITDFSESLRSGEFTFGNKMGLIEDNDVEEEMEDEKHDKQSGSIRSLKVGRGDGAEKPSLCLNGDLREYYTRILKEEPSNPLFIRNYAQFLQWGDLSGAEEYNYHATLADPNNAETLMQYAKLVRELHYDQDKASSYFERVVSVASDDCNVQTAYVRYLWEMEDSEEANSRPPIMGKDEQVAVSSPLHLAIYLGRGNGLRSDVKGNIEENPRDPPIYLRSYPEFPYQLHHDKDKATTYFDPAVQAYPENSYMLAAYARFLWEVDEDDEEIELGMQDRMRSFREMTGESA